MCSRAKNSHVERLALQLMQINSPTEKLAYNPSLLESNCSPGVVVTLGIWYIPPEACTCTHAHGPMIPEMSRPPRNISDAAVKLLPWPGPEVNGQAVSTGVALPKALALPTIG